MLVQSRGQMNVSASIKDVSIVSTGYRSLGDPKTLQNSRSKVRRGKPYEVVYLTLTHTVLCLDLLEVGRGLV